MKYLILPLLLLSSCVTSGDLRVVNAELGRIEAALNDESMSTEEVSEEVAAAREAIAAVASEVENRTDGVLGALNEQGGLVGLLAAGAAAFGVNRHRNGTRKRNVVMKDPAA